MTKKHLVTGAAGMIGSHLCRRLVQQGEEVVGVDNLSAGSMQNIKDIKGDFEFIKGDCRDFELCKRLVMGKDRVWSFAANMGGITKIVEDHADIIYDNALINLNMIKVVQLTKVDRIFQSSSACVYSDLYQREAQVTPLKEEHAYPALPNEPYGWEKLFTEQVFAAFAEDYGVNVRQARFHNIFGECYTAFDDERAKVPCKMLLKAMRWPDETIEIWNDGEQTRSFLYIDDCIDGILKLMESDHNQPINIGSDRLVTMNQLAQIVKDISGKPIEPKYYPDKPQGVRGRNSDNTLVKQVLGWEPKVSLEDGMKRVWEWGLEHYDELEGV